MSRALIEQLLTTDATLAGLGIDANSVFNQHDLRERPKTDHFIVIRWEESTQFSQAYTGMANGLTRAPRVMTLWVHSLEEVSTDFEHIDQIIDRIDFLFADLEDSPGSDGYTITQIRNSGRSGDLEDEVLRTVARNASYSVLYRRT